MKETFYRNLVNQLKICDKNDYLKKDKNVFLKIEETICYVLKYTSLPQKNVTFRCEGVSAIEWISQIKDYPEPLYVAFSAFVNQYSKNSKSQILKIWQYKYEYFSAHVLENTKIPLAYEKSFFDGTDMRKWYNTQLYRLQGKKTPLNDYQKECMEKLFILLRSFGITNKLMPVPPCFGLSNENKLNELYLFILENKKIPLITDKFSDGTNMATFYNSVCSQKIILSEKEQMLFNRLLFFIERYKKDKIIGKVKYSCKRKDFVCKTKGVISPKFANSFMKEKPISNCHIEILEKASMGSYLAYFRNCLHLKTKEMANLLSITLDNYIHIENNDYVFSYFRRMQFKVLLDRYEKKDAILLEMQKVIDLSLKNENKLEYYLNQLTAMLFLNTGEEREEVNLFAKKYRTRKDVLPNRNFSLAKKVLLYTDIEELEKISLLRDERKTISTLKKILKQDILKDNSHGELLNKTNICLGIRCTSISSIYSLSVVEAEHLLEIYESYRLRNDLTKEQVYYLEECCYLLTCVLNPSKDFSFEVRRFQFIFGLSTQKISNLIGFDRNHLAHSLVHNSFSSNLIQRLIESLDKYGILPDNEDFLRFKTSLLEYNQLHLTKKNFK